MAENKVVDFIEKAIHHRTSYTWKCGHNAYLSIKRIRTKKLNLVVSFSFPSPPPLFFGDNAKKLFRSNDAKRRKKGGCPFNIVIWLPQSIKV